jgi:hypothetical protein
MARDVDSREFAPGDEVDHATDRIGAVERRSAIFQHLDALDCCERDCVQIDRAAEPIAKRIVFDASAVQQHQRAGAAETAQGCSCNPGDP